MTTREDGCDSNVIKNSNNYNTNSNGGNGMEISLHFYFPYFVF